MFSPSLTAPAFVRLSIIFRALLGVALCTLGSARALADDRAAVRIFVQDFYASYSAAQDPEKFLTRSKKVTPGLKKAYLAFLKKDVGYDPIIQGQDVPSSGYRAGEVALEDQKATVSMVPQDKGFKTLKVQVVSQGNQWQINGVNDLIGK